MIPIVWAYFIANLLLQVFDGILTYQVLSLGIPEANPLVSAAVTRWGAVWGLLYWKTIACLLLAFVFACRHRRQRMTIKALELTGAVYAWFAVLSVCEWVVLQMSA
jgi:hypothetical protein